MVFEQSIDQPINISIWRRDEDLGYYPEGARDKILVYCPNPAPYKYLKSNHRYLFKKSSHRYPEQYWAEIFAYRLGICMGIEVPRAFVAYDDDNQSAALIEWFYSPQEDSYIAGGDYFKNKISNFDRKSGKQHNFETVEQIFKDLENIYLLDWKAYWAKAFLFDALIGNTDRHQDNWGIVVTKEYKNTNLRGMIKELRISPVFDNGTSMGHEIFANKFNGFKNIGRLEKYVLNGKHHMKWASTDLKRIEHANILKKFIGLYPETRHVMLNCLNRVGNEVFEKILNELIKFDVPVKLSAERANFMLELLRFRHQRLLNELEK